MHCRDLQNNWAHTELTSVFHCALLADLPPVRPPAPSFCYCCTAEGEQRSTSVSNAGKKKTPFRYETGTSAALCSCSKRNLEHTFEKPNGHFLAAPFCNIWYTFCMPRFPRGVNCFFLSTFLSHLQHFTICRNLAANLKQSPQFRAIL